MKGLSLAAVVVGAAMLLLSFAWTHLFPVANSWTVEKNERMSQLSLQAHALGGQLDSAQRRPSMHGRSVAELESEYKKVVDELTQLREEFESKLDRPQWIAALLRWGGVACIVVGAIPTLAGRG